MKKIIYIIFFFNSLNSIEKLPNVLDKSSFITIKEKLQNSIPNFSFEWFNDINAKDNVDGCTALMLATSIDDKELIELLIEKGADINAQDKYGDTALIMASAQGNKEIVELLIANGADINARDRYGDTALIMASAKGHEEIVKLLMDNGAKTQTMNNMGWNAKEFARYNPKILYLFKNKRNNNKN